VRTLVNERFGALQTQDVPIVEDRPSVARKVIIRNKDLEQSLLCLGTSSYPQNHNDRYAVYLLDIILGGSMSSRLFQNIRERRGLAYAVSSNVSTYRDTGSFTVHAGCANEAVGEVVDLVVEEIKTLKRESVPEGELQRSKDHLKGSLMLSLESTANRMSHLARQEMYFGRQIGLDETIDGINRVTPIDLQRVAEDIFKPDALSATVLGNVNGLELPLGRLDLA
jgi:predicted Zn-dependent peptidase